MCRQAFVPALLVSVGTLCGQAFGQLDSYYFSVYTSLDPGPQTEILEIPSFVAPYGDGPLMRVEIHANGSLDHRVVSSQPVVVGVTASDVLRYSFSLRFVDGPGLLSYQSDDLGPYNIHVPAGFESPGAWRFVQWYGTGTPRVYLPGTAFFDEFLGPDPLLVETMREPMITVLRPPTPDYISFDGRVHMEIRVRYFFVPAPSGAVALMIALGASVGRRRRG